jgi:hypothetical protein
MTISNKQFTSGRIATWAQPAFGASELSMLIAVEEHQSRNSCANGSLSSIYPEKARNSLTFLRRSARHSKQFSLIEQVLALQGKREEGANPSLSRNCER